MSEKPFLALEEIWNRIGKDSLPSNFSDKILLHNKLLNFFHVGDYYYYVFNIGTVYIEFVQDKMQSMLGYSKEWFTPENIVSSIHPDDVQHFVNFENTTAIFLNKLPVEKLQKYKISYDYRLKKANGEFIRILQQNVTIENSEQGAVLRTLGMHTDITHLKKETKASLSFIGIDGEPSFYDVDIHNVFKNEKGLFSKREKEILTYIANGYKSKEISELLFVSKATVDTHRRNIMRKSECSSITELIVKAVKEGWV